MYRKFKDNKDNEYEAIIKKQVNESRLVAEQEGITIPKTLDDYVAPSRAGALGLNTGKNGKKSAYNTSHEDDVDLGIDVRLFFFRKKKKSIFYIFYFNRMMMIKWLIWLMMMKDLMKKVIEKNKNFFSFSFCLSV